MFLSVRNGYRYLLLQTRSCHRRVSPQGQLLWWRYQQRFDQSRLIVSDFLARRSCISIFISYNACVKLDYVEMSGQW